MLEDSLLKACREVFDELTCEFGFFFLEEVLGLSFDTREGEVEVLPTSHGFFEGIDGVAGFGHFSEDWSTRIAKI